MQNELTSKIDWEVYWSNHKCKVVSSETIYDNYIPYLKGAQSFIEIGGFPGNNAVFFYKNVCKDVTLLDFFVDRTIVTKMEQINLMPKGSIKCIETDFLRFEGEIRYDIVFSSGFIEHFNDTRNVIYRHVNILSENGYLLITLPNFRGLNGYIQWLFDRKNLRAHNLQSMKINHLKEIMNEFGLTSWTVEYSGKPTVWLEPKQNILNIVRKILILGLAYFITLFPIKGRFLSPYIIIFGKK